MTPKLKNPKDSKRKDKKSSSSDADGQAHAADSTDESRRVEEELKEAAKELDSNITESKEKADPTGIFSPEDKTDGQEKADPTGVLSNEPRTPKSLKDLAANIQPEIIVKQEPNADQIQARKEMYESRAKFFDNVFDMLEYHKVSLLGEAEINMAEHRATEEERLNLMYEEFARLSNMEDDLMPFDDFMRSVIVFILTKEPWVGGAESQRPQSFMRLVVEYFLDKLSQWVSERTSNLHEVEQWFEYYSIWWRQYLDQQITLPLLSYRNETEGSDFVPYVTFVDGEFRGFVPPIKNFTEQPTCRLRPPYHQPKLGQSSADVAGPDQENQAVEDEGNDEDDQALLNNSQTSDGNCCARQFSWILRFFYAFCGFCIIGSCCVLISYSPGYKGGANHDHTSGKVTTLCVNNLNLTVEMIQKNLTHQEAGSVCGSRQVWPLLMGEQEYLEVMKYLQETEGLQGRSLWLNIHAIGKCPTDKQPEESCVLEQAKNGHGIKCEFAKETDWSMLVGLNDSKKCFSAQPLSADDEWKDYIWFPADCIENHWTLCVNYGKPGDC